jgi:hypothetical protein
MKSSIRTFALATSLLAITLSAMPNNAAALMRASGDKPVKYMSISTAASSSSADTIMGIVAMAVDIYLWFPTAR